MSLSTLEREVFVPRRKKQLLQIMQQLLLIISMGMIEAGTYQERGSGFCLEAPQASQGQSKKKGVAAKPKHNKDFGYI